MKRRQLLKNFGLGISAMIALPTWANAWSPSTFSPSNFLSENEKNLLADLVECMIPTTNSPGAKTLKIHLFVERMLVDCYDKKSQELFKIGLSNAQSTISELPSKSINGLKNSELLDFIEKLKVSNVINGKFVGLLKENTIKGYLNSEYVMTNLRIYEMLPGEYQPCVKLKS